MSGPKDARPLVGTERAQREQCSTDEHIVGDDPGSSKRFVTLQALLAIRGFQLIALSCGGFLICRWDRSAHAPDLRGVEAFLERVGGKLL